ncbi:MAG: methyltransferase domain-containing protein [Acidimicrobiales bacterium]|nr:methyltransferase domain-containing protein [Acidimicrobiales bacterium]
MGPGPTGRPGHLGQTGEIADLHLTPTGYERLLPPGVQLTVKTRRRALAQRARGRVLDLGGAEGHRSLWDRPGVDATVLAANRGERLAGLADRGARFDTVFSVFQLVAAPDLAATLTHLGEVLAPEGALHFLEPARLRGRITGRAQRVVAPVVDAATGWRVDRDLPRELRAAGLSVTDLERHRTGTVQWWLRSLVEGRAHHALPVGR